MRKLNREQKRRIINAKKQNLLPEIERLYVDSYNEGVRDGSLTILLALRDRFGFGNERIKRVLEHCTIYMQGTGKISLQFYEDLQRGCRR